MEERPIRYCLPSMVTCSPAPATSAWGASFRVASAIALAPAVPVAPPGLASRNSTESAEGFCVSLESTDTDERGAIGATIAVTAAWNWSCLVDDQPMAEAHQAVALERVLFRKEEYARVGYHAQARIPLLMERVPGTIP